MEKKQLLGSIVIGYCANHNQLGALKGQLNLDIINTPDGRDRIGKIWNHIAPGFLFSLKTSFEKGAMTQ